MYPSTVSMGLRKLSGGNRSPASITSKGLKGAKIICFHYQHFFPKNRSPANTDPICICFYSSVNWLWIILSIFWNDLSFAFFRTSVSMQVQTLFHLEFHESLYCQFLLLCREHLKGLLLHPSLSKNLIIHGFQVYCSKLKVCIFHHQKVNCA